MHGVNRMQITRSGSRPSAKGPADWFTGSVRIHPLFPNAEPARAAGSAVMTHIAVQEALHGTVVQWLEHVSDEEYHGRSV